MYCLKMLKDTIIKEINDKYEEISSLIKTTSRTITATNSQASKWYID